MSDIPENRFQLRQYVLQLLSRMAKWTTLARNGRAGYVGVTGPARNPAQGDKDVEGLARRYQHFGFRSRAPKNSEVILLALRAGSANQVVIAEESFGHGPRVEDLKDGEVAIYCKASGAVIKFDENGKISIAAAAGQNISIDAGAGANVVVNNGTLDVARKTDQVQVTIPIGAIKVGGMPLANTEAVTVSGTITSVGQTRFKG